MVNAIREFLRKRLILVFFGAAFGFLFALYEMVMGYIPMVWRWTLPRVFGEEFLFTAGFHILFFSIVSLPTLLFPEKVRKVAPLCLYYFLVVLVLTILGSQKVKVVVFMRIFSATAAVATLYGSLKMWSSGGKVRRYSLVSLCMIVGAIPFILLAFGSRVPEASTSDVDLSLKKKPNLLLIVYDTVNFSHLPSYGYERNTAPNFSAIASDGVLFERIYTTGSWTIPSHASMFTGRFPMEHNATHEHPYLGESEWTLAEHLKRAGYRTVAFSCNPWIGRGTGFGQGFDEFTEMWRGFMRDEIYLLHRFWSVYFNRKKDKGGALLLRQISRWARAESHKRPFFMFVNLMEAHAPYNQLPDNYLHRYIEGRYSASMLAKIGAESVGLQLFWRLEGFSQEELKLARAMYDAGIYYDDWITGRIIDILHQRGLMENTIVILITDHGELFGEHGYWGHEVSLLEPLTRIAMALKWEGGHIKPHRISTPVSVVDLLPTLDEMLSVEGDFPLKIHGRSVKHLIMGTVDSKESIRIAENYVPLHLHTSWRYNHPFSSPPDIISQRLLSFWYGDLKYVRVMDMSGKLIKEMVFNVEDDPDEQFDISETEGGRYLEEMRGRFARVKSQIQREHGGERKAFHFESVPTLDEETRERLKKLGYLGSGK